MSITSRNVIDELLRSTEEGDLSRQTECIKFMESNLRTDTCLEFMKVVASRKDVVQLMDDIYDFLEENLLVAVNKSTATDFPMSLMVEILENKQLREERSPRDLHASAVKWLQYNEWAWESPWDLLKHVQYDEMTEEELMKVAESEFIAKHPVIGCMILRQIIPNCSVGDDVVKGEVIPELKKICDSATENGNGPSFQFLAGIKDYSREIEIFYDTVNERGVSAVIDIPEDCNVITGSFFIRYHKGKTYFLTITDNRGRQKSCEEGMNQVHILDSATREWTKGTGIAMDEFIIHSELLVFILNDCIYMMAKEKRYSHIVDYRYNIALDAWEEIEDVRPGSLVFTDMNYTPLGGVLWVTTSEGIFTLHLNKGSEGRDLWIQNTRVDPKKKPKRTAKHLLLPYKDHLYLSGTIEGIERCVMCYNTLENKWKRLEFTPPGDENWTVWNTVYDAGRGIAYNHNKRGTIWKWDVEKSEVKKIYRIHTDFNRIIPI